MVGRRWIPLLGVGGFLLAVTSLGEAGSPDAPEISDPPNDSSNSQSGYFDILGVWFTMENHTRFSVTMLVQRVWQAAVVPEPTCDLREHVRFYEYEVHFAAFGPDDGRLAAERNHTYIRLFMGDTCYQFSSGLASGHGYVDWDGKDPNELPVEGEFTEDRIIWHVDLGTKHVPIPTAPDRGAGYRLGETYAVTERGSDWAPDGARNASAHGRDFLVPPKLEAPGGAGAEEPAAEGPPSTLVVPPRPRDLPPGDGSPVTAAAPATTQADDESFGLYVVLPAAVVGVATALLYESVRLRLFQFAIVPLFSRLEKDEVLDNERRASLFDAIRANPGTSFSNLRRVSELGSGALAHHLRVLESQGFVRPMHDGTRTRFYLAGSRIALEPYLTATQHALLDLITANPGIDQAHLARMAGLSRKGASYHVDRLAAAGKVSLSYQGNKSRHFAMDPPRPSRLNVLAPLRP